MHVVHQRRHRRSTDRQPGTATSQTLPPYSLTLLDLHPAGADRRRARRARAARPPTAVTDRDRDDLLAGRAAGGSPIAKYEVYRQNGAISEQLGETTGTSFTVAQPRTRARRYTVNVLARDTAGRRLLVVAAADLHHRRARPTARCTVRFTDATDWGNGYVGSVDITNNAARRRSTAGRSTFTWPTGWQQREQRLERHLDADRHATVRVTNADNGTLAAGGGTANVGFVGAYSGPNVLPGVFTLNGTVCTTG